MNALPRSQKSCQILLKRTLNADNVARRKAVVLSDRDRTRRIVQSEDRFVTLPNDVHMSRAMVIGVNSHPPGANPQNGWHELILSQTEAVGL
jgi:hypothetical protein